MCITNFTFEKEEKREKQELKHFYVNELLFICSRY